MIETISYWRALKKARGSFRRTIVEALEYIGESSFLVRGKLGKFGASARGHMKLNGQDFSRLDLERRSGDITSAGGVRKVVLDDGSERGVRVLEFRTGTGLAFDVLVDRAMDFGQAEHKGRSFGWCSPTGIRHPGLHENADEDGVAWLRSFSGLQTTGGLDHIFAKAEVDASQYRYPLRKKMQQGLHGRVANIPASLHGYGQSWEGDRCVLSAEGEIRQAAVFGEHLRLRRRIESEIGSNEIRLHDTVRNYGFERSPHMLLYHIDLGWPLLDEGTRLVAPIARTLWYSPVVDQQRSSYQVMAAPTAGFDEQAYEHELVADPSGKMRIAVVNERINFGVMVEWYAKEFPCFLEWLHLREGAYVIGVEPSTHHVQGDQAARDNGSMIWLEHGESRTYRSVITVLDGQEAVRRAIEAIRKVAVQPDADVPPLASRS